MKMPLKTKKDCLNAGKLTVTMFFQHSVILKCISIWGNSRYVNNESVYDTLRREWANKYSTVTTNLQKAATTQKSAMPLESDESDLQMGWALSKAKTGGIRFPTKVRQYLVAKFNYGQKTGKKCDPVQVATDRRKAKNQSGDRLFTREEWLTATQVKGFFSRLSKL